MNLKLRIKQEDKNLIHTTTQKLSKRIFSRKNLYMYVYKIKK